MKEAIKALAVFTCVLCGAGSSNAIVIPAGEDPAFNNRVRSYLAEAKQKSPYLNDLIRAAETAPNVIYVYPITDDKSTWHYRGDRTISHTDPRDSKPRGAARNTPTDSYIFINLERIDPNNRTFGRGTLIHEFVHAMDLAMGQYNSDYTIREKRAVFFENIWRESQNYNLRTSYSGRFPTREYQNEKTSNRIEQFIAHYHSSNDVP